jgi:Polyketide cyclase / dehydrase and lipid transport
MKGRSQWKASIIIAASRNHVWSVVDDITLIPNYHPEVRKVDLLSGHRNRQIGARYRCTITEGRKGSCVEEVVECLPGERMATAFSEDTWGISEMFRDFVVESVLLPRGSHETIVVLEAFYEPVGLKAKFLNALFLRGMMKRRALRTLQGIKRMVESHPE